MPLAGAAVCVERGVARTASEPNAPGCAGEVAERPAVAQEQREGDQPRELAGRNAGDRADESIEFVRDVEFIEQGVDEATRPREMLIARHQLVEHLETVAFSPMASIDTRERPNAWLMGRDSSVWQSVAHGRHLRRSARLCEPKAATMRDGGREGRVMDVA